jgi:Lon protease-like protein
MNEPQELPLFPLATVLFPGGRLPLRIFEPRYLEMTAACLRNQRPFGVALIRGGFEVGKPAIPWDIGCTARILSCEESGAGLKLLLAQGESVFRIAHRWSQPDGLLQARVELRDPPDPTPLPEDYNNLADLLRKLAEEIGEVQLPWPHRFEDAGWVGFRLAELLPVAPERKQRLLELEDPLKILADVQQLLGTLR